MPKIICQECQQYKSAPYKKDILCQECKIMLIKSGRKTNLKNNMEEEKTDNEETTTIPEEGADAGAVGEPETTETEETKEEETA